MISVLIPSRGNPEKLRDAVDSLYKRCVHPDRVEIVVRADDDDENGTVLLREWMKVSSGARVKILVGPQLGGYSSMHDFYDECARASSGDWLFLYNDDCEMMTDGWDDVIEREDSDSVVVLRPHGEGNYAPHINNFPVLSRPYYEVVGYISQSYFCDAWITLVSKDSGVEKKIDVRIHHGFGSHDSSLDDNFPRALMRWEDQIFSPEMNIIRIDEVDRIHASLGKFSNTGGRQCLAESGSLVLANLGSQSRLRLRAKGMRYVGMTYLRRSESS